MSEIRLDPVTKRKIILAPDRKNRPHDYKKKNLKKICPFCKGNEEETPPEILRVPDNENWNQRVVPNKFPALENKKTFKINFEESDLNKSFEGVGTHEVIVETSNHNKNWFENSKKDYEDILKVYLRRYKELNKREDIKYISVFKNHLRGGGASLEHPHSQIMALNFIPKLIQEEVDGSYEYYKEEGKCVYCEIIKEEILNKERIVCKNEHFIAIVPYASEFSYEVEVFPIVHSHAFLSLKEENIEALAQILKEVFERMSKVLKEFPFNMYIHTIKDKKEEFSTSYHYHIKILPRLFTIAGFEYSTGVNITSIKPEEAARQLREVKLENLR